MIGVLLAVCAMACGMWSDAPPTLHYPGSYAFGRVARGHDVLAPELAALYEQFRPGDLMERYSASQLATRFGIVGDSANPVVSIAVVGSGLDAAQLEKVDVDVKSRSGDRFYASVPVLGLRRLAELIGIVSIAALRPVQIPADPQDGDIPKIRPRGVARGSEAFDAKGLTGKGVIIGVIDSGVDWRHKDFQRADGTTRILYLYDMWDDTWTDSAGKTGTEPPLKDKKGPVGTLYTADQINAALKGSGTVNSRDIIGHGTAVSGTAAGNGRGTGNGVPEGIYKGVAPDADLIVVKAFRDSGIINMDYYLAAKWIADVAAKLGRPCVINMSLGGHDSAHDGDADEEKFLDSLVGAGKPGVVICVSAGNEGKHAFHAGGRFGPRRDGQGDVESEPIELFVTARTELDAYFDVGDEWGFAVLGRDQFLTDPAGKPLACMVTYSGATRKLDASLSSISGDAYNGPIWKGGAPAEGGPKSFEEYFNKQNGVTVTRAGAKYDRLQVVLYPGKYWLYAYGASEKVTNGRFDLYMPFTTEATFGKGEESRFLIGSPGNASNVLTIGSYDFRDKWNNIDGKQTTYNLELGGISDFSSVGYRRDGAIKPDIVAPGRYMISTLAEGCKMGRTSEGTPDKLRIAQDGAHIAWCGTSAATPYATGVIALMLQKNPKLDAAQVQEILRKTAMMDTFTGAVPNFAWGNGKLNPEKSLAQTPVPK